MSASPLISFIQGVGGPELLVIFLIVLLFFGARRLPELARGLGKSMKEFKNATQEVQDDFREAMDSVDPNKPDPKKSPPAKSEAKPAEEKKAESHPTV
ncbi:MAG: Sec-independent protein translocase subunit TatA/TatB [Verrucomicrobiota bacterium]